MSALTLANLTTTTYAVDKVIEGLHSETDHGNSDERANKGGDDPYYFHPVGHDGGWATLGTDRLFSYMQSLATCKINSVPPRPRHDSEWANLNRPHMVDRCKRFSKCPGAVNRTHSKYIALFLT